MDVLASHAWSIGLKFSHHTLRVTLKPEMSSVKDAEKHMVC
jgi:hypothetical protein